MRIPHLILLILVVAVWGFNFVVIEIGVHEIPPLMLCAIRFLLTAVPAIFFFKRPAVPFMTLILFGLTMFALQFGFLFGGIYEGVTPGLAALIIQTQVFFTVVFATVFLNEKTNLWQIAGILTAFAGISLVGIKLDGHVSLLGFAFLIAAGMSWSLGNLIAKKITSVNMFSLVIWGNLIAFFPTFVCALFFEGKTALFITLSHFNDTSVAAILYLVYVSTMFGYGTWSWLIKNYPITILTPYALLIPILGFLSSALVLHEPLQSWKLMALVLIIIGLMVNFLGTRKNKTPSLQAD